MIFSIDPTEYGPNQMKAQKDSKAHQGNGLFNGNDGNDDTGFLRGQEQQLSEDIKIDIPKFDSKKYRLIQLENGLKTLIIENSKSKKMDISLAIKYGCLQDPVGMFIEK